MAHGRCKQCGGTGWIRSSYGKKKVRCPGDFSSPISGPIHAGQPAERLPQTGSPKGANHAALHEEFQKNSVDRRRTTAGDPDWHRDQGDHVLNNPHPSFDGFINVSPTESGGYEAVAYEFMDPEGVDISDADSKEFKTLEEAKEWAETWLPPDVRDKDTDTQPHWQSEGAGMVLTNPHPSLDGFIDVMPVEGGKYEASVYEFADQEGLDIFNVESREFDTIEDAKRWAEGWDNSPVAR